MKFTSSPFVFLLFCLLSSCQKLTPLEPPNPILGGWIMEKHEIYNLPPWFIKKTRSDYWVTPTDTIYANGTLSQAFNVHALTFKNEGNFTEKYFKNGGLRDIATIQVDSGQWTLADSIVTLAVNNTLPHKLTYSAVIDRLVTDRFHQISVLRFADGTIDTIRYDIRLWYRRDL